ncbi:MAG TPA: YdeI/OmpD-associated family protein [Vicinamibacterales bacterium]|nr:YdeI/OmpD-associated family protein [Vicinamibacterales bacterium]
MARQPAKESSRSSIPTRAEKFTAVVATDSRKRVVVPVPFDPDDVWGPKPQHHVAGTMNGGGVRAVIERVRDGHVFSIGPAWRRGCGIEVGDQVTVVLIPEGPQRDDLASDVVAAFEASPEAGAFFDSLAQFYRKGYLRWIDATKRSPAIRAERIAEMVKLLEARVKQR